jgi:AcrR family transcriptional regulator
MTKVHKLTGRDAVRASSAKRAAGGGDRRSERTRAAIRDAANSLFLEHGVDKTTVDAICAAAGVSKGTFYLYFHRNR